MSDKPEPDAFGRFRVKDQDTGHKVSIPAAELDHGNYLVLKQDASDPVTGVILPPEFADPGSNGQTATTKKENN